MPTHRVSQLAFRYTRDSDDTRQVAHVALQDPEARHLKHSYRTAASEEATVLG